MENKINFTIINIERENNSDCVENEEYWQYPTCFTRWDYPRYNLCFINDEYLFTKKERICCTKSEGIANIYYSKFDLNTNDINDIYIKMINSLEKNHLEIPDEKKDYLHIIQKMRNGKAAHGFAIVNCKPKAGKIVEEIKEKFNILKKITAFETDQELFDFFLIKFYNE